MRLFSSSSASASERVTVISIFAMCDTISWMPGLVQHAVHAGLQGQAGKKALGIEWSICHRLYQRLETAGELGRTSIGRMPDRPGHNDTHFPQQSFRLLADRDDLRMRERLDQHAQGRLTQSYLLRRWCPVRPQVIRAMRMQLHGVPQDGALCDAEPVECLPYDGGGRFREGQAPGRQSPKRCGDARYGTLAQQAFTGEGDP